MPKLTDPAAQIPSLTRRDVLKTAAVPLAAALTASIAGAQNAERPNIVFLMADDLGYADVSCYGRREYQTPAIDSLAVDGLKLTQAYANSAVCSATRTALMTGRYQYRLEVGLVEPLGTGSTRYGLPPDHPTLPSLLRDAGYQTALVGKWHLGNAPDYGPLLSGYDHFWGFKDGLMDYFTHKSAMGDRIQTSLWNDNATVEENGYLTDLMGAKAIEMIEEMAAAESPFFLSLHFNAPHWPWEGPEDEAVAQDRRSLVDYDGGSMATYAAMVTSMDAQIANVLAKLDELGIAGNTIVVFTSDNGGERFSDTWPFTGMKQELLEGGLRIPTLVRWPGHVPAGAESDQILLSMDWLPTLVAAAGAAPAPGFPPDGVNLLAQLTGAVAPVSRRVYWRYDQNAQHAVRDGDMKYLKIRDNTFLFNVVKDPLERANLKNRQPEVYQRLIEDFEEWNRQMLPERPRNSGGNLANSLADHIGNDPVRRAAPQQ